MTLAALLGAAWRRWWGDARPSWAFPGFRALQACIGLCALFCLCMWAGHSWWASAIRAALAIGFLTAVAQSIPHVWWAWEWVNLKVGGLNSRYRLIDGFTTWAEMTAGAIVFGLAVWI